MHYIQIWMDECNNEQSSVQLIDKLNKQITEMTKN